MANVTAAKPKTGGACYRAAAGTTMPTDATTSLAAAFKALGYISDDGLSHDMSISSDKIKAWGGDTVLTPQTEKNDDFTFTLIEALNLDVLKTVYGDSNVSGTLAAGVTVKGNAAQQVSAAWVFEIILADNAVKRICIPSGAISNIGEVAYKDGEPVGYEITISCFPDSQGNTHYEYIKSA